MKKARELLKDEVNENLPEGQLLLQVGHNRGETSVRDTQIQNRFGLFLVYLEDQQKIRYM